MLIAVWNTAFLGDAILTLPLIQTLKHYFSQAKIHYYVRQGLKDLFSSHPDIDEVYEFNKKKSSFRYIFDYGKEIAEKKYAIWISAHTSLRSTLIAELSKASIRIGYNSGFLSRLVYNHTVNRCFYQLEEIERLLQLTCPLGIDPKNYDTWPRLSLPKTAQEVAEKIWGNKVKRRVLGIHPGSVWATKQWPAEYFAEIARLAAENNMQVMLFSGPAEKNQAIKVREYSQLKSDQLIDLSAQLSLPELAACLGRLDYYLSNDSGPMHIAWTMHTPLTALFGPTTKSLGFFPRGEKSDVMEIDLKCRPCGLHGHKKCPKNHHQCMRQLLPSVVWENIKKKMSI